MNAVGKDEEVLRALRVPVDRFFEVFGESLDASSEIRNFALRVADDSVGRGLPESALRLVERYRPKSGFLRAACLNSLTNSSGGTSWHRFSTALAAGEILGRNFPLDTTLEDEMIARLRRNRSDPGAIAALCEGWPKSDKFEEVRSEFRGNWGLPLPLYARLMCAAGSPAQFSQGLEWLVDNLAGDLWDASFFWVPGVVRRLKDDDEAYCRVFDILTPTAKPAVKASVPKLLARSRRLSDELRKWCIGECERAKGDCVAEVGLDVIAGQHRVVVHCLFELLLGEDPIATA